MWAMRKIVKLPLRYELEIQGNFGSVEDKEGTAQAREGGKARVAIKAQSRNFINSYIDTTKFTDLHTHTSAQWSETQASRTDAAKEKARELREEFMGCFAELLHCTGDEFRVAWANPAGDHVETAPKLVEYLHTEWIEDRCYTEVFDCFLTTYSLLHFNHKSTGTNEGAHATLKRQLLDGTKDLPIVVPAAHSKLQLEIREFKA